MSAGHVVQVVLLVWGVMTLLPLAVLVIARAWADAAQDGDPMARLQAGGRTWTPLVDDRQVERADFAAWSQELRATREAEQQRVVRSRARRRTW